MTHSLLKVVLYVTGLLRYLLWNAQDSSFHRCHEVLGRFQTELLMRSWWVLLCFRGESLDNLDSPRSCSWRQSPWLNQSSGVYASSSVQDFSRSSPQFLSTSNRAYMRNPSSSVAPPSGSVKTAAPSGTATTRSATLPSHSISTSQSSSQLRSRWGLVFPVFLSWFQGPFSFKISPGLCQHSYKEIWALLSVSEWVLSSTQLRNLS